MAQKASKNDKVEISEDGILDFISRYARYQASAQGKTASLRRGLRTPTRAIAINHDGHFVAADVLPVEPVGRGRRTQPDPGFVPKTADEKLLDQLRQQCLNNVSENRVPADVVIGDLDELHAAYELLKRGYSADDKGMLAQGAFRVGVQLATIMLRGAEKYSTTGTKITSARQRVNEDRKAKAAPRRVAIAKAYQQLRKSGLTYKQAISRLKERADLGKPSRSTINLAIGQPKNLG